VQLGRLKFYNVRFRKLIIRYEFKVLFRNADCGHIRETKARKHSPYDEVTKEREISKHPCKHKRHN